MRIVVVEDEAPIRGGMAKILQTISPKYELVGVASDGLSGYAMIQREQPDLVIMDIRMPKLDGLEMLRQLREDGVTCKAVILSAYSEFEYAKKAIEYGIIAYLLKPIKVPELKAALRQAEDELRLEHNRENVFSIDNIIMGCLNGQVKADESFHEMTKEWHGFTVLEPVEILMVWLGDRFEEQKRRAREILEHVAEQSVKCCAYIKENESWKVLLLILYRLPKGVSKFERYQKEVVPRLAQSLDGSNIFVWRRAEDMLHMPEALREMFEELEWNLRFEPGHLLCREEIEGLQSLPVKYPMALEESARQAILKKDEAGLADSGGQLVEYLKRAECPPKRKKEILIRFHWALANRQWVRKDEAELRLQQILQNIAVAVTWEQIEEEMRRFMSLICKNSENPKEASVSQMVLKAKDLIQNYYSQGITLEETARKLFVSEEYLSAQFKKETGVSFSETIRRCRIEKVKQLLLDTPLKLNQIADLAGYSDPKYMSRVFKDEVGMLPGEFRKAVH